MRFVGGLVASGMATAGALAAIVHYAPMQIYEESYPMYAFVQEVEAEDARRAPPATTLIVGDSRAKAGLLPEKLGPGSLSLTLPGASAIELYYAVDRYLRQHPAPKNVVISISAVHFADSFIFWERPVKFAYFDDDTVAEVLTTAERLGDPTFGTPLAARSTYLLHRYNSPHLYLPELRTALFQPHGEANQRLLDELRAHHGHCYFGKGERADGLAFENAHTTFAPAPTFDHYFHKLLDRLRATGAKVVFQAMPLNRRSQAELNPGYAAAYRSYFRRLSAEYRDVRFEADWPLLDDACFGDNNHVNSRGSEIVTQRAREILHL